MFEEGGRAELRDTLVRAAEVDERVTAAAFVGSTAEGAEDRWSDIDLALAVSDGGVVGDWTERMAGHGAVDHTDVVAGPALYRVFLLASSLQVDISFWPPSAFGATGPRFRLLFGEAPGGHAPPRAPAAEDLIGMSWLYALHVRSSLRRERPWQAEWFLNGMRDRCLALACLRHGLPHREGRGIDRLPPRELAVAEDGVPRAATPAEVERAFGALLTLLEAEVVATDPSRAERLRAPLAELRV